MLAVATVALLLAVEPAQEAIENLATQESEVLLYEDSNNEEIAVNEEEADQMVVLEDGVNELSDEAAVLEEEI